MLRRRAETGNNLPGSRAERRGNLARGCGAWLPTALAPAAAALGALALLTGCIYLPSKSGTGRVLVVGIGLVTVNDRTNQAMVATSTQVLGVEVSHRPGLKFAVGYASGVVTTVSDGAEDVRAEVSHYPFGPVNVTVQKADLAFPTNETEAPNPP